MNNKFFSVWLIGCTLTLFLYFASIHYYKNKLQDRTEMLTEQAAELIQQRFKKYEYGLLSTRGAILIAGVDAISRQSFNRYIASLSLVKEFPGARGFGFIRRIYPEQEANFLVQARADDAPNFRVRTLTPHNKDRFIIQYIYPQTTNEGAIGLDIGSETFRRTAAISASVTNKATLSAPITLVQEEGKTRRGFLILLPIYNTLSVNNQAQERLDATIGWSYAPLIVDDVLFDLGPILSQINVTITDKVEQKPFFYAVKASEQNNNITDISVSREINFMGRQWIINTTPHNSISTRTLVNYPTWIIFIGLLITSIFYLGLFVWSLKKSENTVLIDDERDITLSTFFLSRSFARLSKVYFFILLCLITLSSYLYIDQEFNRTASILIDHAQYSKDLINKQQQSYSDSLTFLKSTPAMNKIIKSRFINNSSALEYRAATERLAETFKAYMQSLHDVYQVRLIRAASDGKEIVRVERNNDSIIIANQYNLQSKSETTYYKHTIKLHDGEVFTSSIEPNYENGEMEIPIKLTRRYSTPIFYPDGSLFAMIVINVDAKSLLNNINDITQNGQFIFITDENESFVLADHPSKVYASFTDPGFTWSNAFQRTSNIFEPNNNMLSTWKGENGLFLRAQTITTPNTGNTIGTLAVNATQRLTNIYNNVFSVLIKQLLVLILISLLVLVLYYFSWSTTKRRLISTRIQNEYKDQKRKDNMFESLTELSPEAMVIVDTKGIIVLVNSQAEKLFGYVREQLIGQNINILVPTAFAHNHDRYIKSYIKEPLTRPMGASKELFSRYSDGTEFPVEVSLSPIQLDNKLLIASSIRNISERKSIEKTLREATEKAESANLAKSTFLANMSHEIRTPLNAVIGLAHLLKDNDLTNEQLNHVTNIQLAGRSLLGIVNDVLDLAKIEANEMQVVQAPCNLKDLLNELFCVFLSQAEQKNITFSLEIDPNIFPWVISDRKLLQQIFTNLIGNAIKFTSHGHINIKAVKLDQPTSSSDQQYIRFTIEDTGIGISPEKCQQIFQPFNQVDDGTNKRFEGTGLGLTIVRNISALLGGEVGVESQLDNGSRFWFQAMFNKASSDEHFVGDSILNALNIWIIDEEDKQATTLKMLARSLGWHVFQTATIDDLLIEFSKRSKAGNQLPDVLLINWQLHQLHNLSFLETIFNLPNWNNIPVIAVVSAHQKDYIKKHDINNRVKGILFTPVATSDLFSIVNNTIAKCTGDTIKVLESTKMEAIKAKWLPNVRILVVDDSQLNLEVVEKILTKNGAIVTTANSGILAIEYLEKQHDQFDVVLMDIQMPEMDGLEATSKIRNQLGFKTIPIIALTAGTFAEEKNKALSVGMNAFLTKPIDPSKLILCLREYVEAYRKTAVLVDSIELSEDNKRTDYWPEISGISNSFSLFQGDLALFEFTLKRLFQEHHDIEMLQSSSIDLTNSDIRTSLATKIHKLRGSAGMIGAKNLYNLASRAEISLRQGIDSEQKTILIDIVQAMKTLQEDCHIFLSQQQAIHNKKITTDLSDIKEIDKATLDQLINMLDCNDLSANEFVESNEHALILLLGTQQYEIFSENIRMLDYKKASDILNKINIS